MYKCFNTVLMKYNIVFFTKMFVEFRVTAFALSVATQKDPFNIKNRA